MTQKDIIASLEKFAIQKKLPFYSCFNEDRKIPNLPWRYVASRYLIYDLSIIHNGLYFVFYDSDTGGYRASSGWGATYCGLFKEIENFNYNVTIKKRQWFDKFTFQRRYLTGNRDLDKVITIRTNSKRINHAFHSAKKVLHFSKLMQRINPLKVETEVDCWNIIPSLDHKTLISLTSDRWITDFKDIEWFIVNGSRYLIEDWPTRNN